MDNQRGNKGIDRFGAYFPSIIKFYSIKNEKIAQIIFVLVLIVQMTSDFIRVTMFDTTSNIMSTSEAVRIILIFAVTSFIINIISSVYLDAYLRDLKGMQYTAAQCFAFVRKHAVKLVGANLLYYVMSILSLFFAIVIYIMFIFVSCYVLDKEATIEQAFNGSRNLTKGNKLKIFGIIVSFNVMTLLFSIFIVLGSENIWITVFISSFLNTVLALMKQRLVALMYVDLEYGRGYIEE